MGQKINPVGLRLGVNRTWDSRWFAAGADYSRLLHQDLKLREWLRERLSAAGVSRIIIERPAKKARITIHASSTHSARKGCPRASGLSIFSVRKVTTRRPSPGELTTLSKTALKRVRSYRPGGGSDTSFFDSSFIRSRYSVYATRSASPIFLTQRT